MEVEFDIPSSNASFPKFKTLGASLHVPDSVTSKHSIAIIVHGHGGHRDYCYQRLLSRSLSIASLRFDFSGCGAQLGSGTEVGREMEEIPRTIESDLVDIETVVRYVRSRGYFVTALIGHSRGSVACLQYVKKDFTIPTVVNCSGRYRAHLIHEKVQRNPMLKDGMLGYWDKQRAGTGGALVDKWTLLAEIASVGDQEMKGIGAALSPDIDVLVIFGSKDNIVPVADAGMFINELKERADLYLVDDADHNFFVQASSAGGVKVNKNQEVADLIAHYLSPEATRLRFLRRHAIIRTPRFLKVDGLNNLRDLGGYQQTFPLRFIYRSADLSALTILGAEQLSTHVRTIFDLRADPELASNGTIGPDVHRPLEIKNVRRLHVPIFKHIDYSPTGLSKFFGSAKKTPEEKEAGMVKAYKSILHNARPVFGVIFDHLCGVIEDKVHGRDSRGVLIHCSAGKDRTGILCAVLLLLGGVSEETVALEYELTTYGLATDADSLHHSALIRQSMQSDIPVPEIGRGSFAETMRKTIHLLQLEFGGVDRYLASCVDAQQLRLVKQYLMKGTLERSRL